MVHHSSPHVWIKIFYNLLAFKREISKLEVIGLSIILITSTSLVSAIRVGVYAQQHQQPPLIGIKITSPIKGQQVPVGQLTISGTSTDNATTDCQVYVDWNNTKPFQTATATGPGGGVNNDYSTWTFTYTDKYHLITNGTNDITSKLSCVNDSTGGTTTANLTKSYSVDVIGVAATTTNDTTITISGSEEVQQQESPTIDSNITNIIEDIKAATTTSPESNTTVPTTPSIPLSQSIEEQEEEEDTTIYWDIE